MKLYPEMSRRKIVERFISSRNFSGTKCATLVSLHRRYMIELDNKLRFWLLSGDGYVSPAMATGSY